MSEIDGSVLQLRDVVCRFGGLTAIDGVSLDFHPRQLYAIIGPNGAGKTTLFNLISGAVRPTAGRITFEGKDITKLNVHEVARLGIVRKFQVPRVFATMTVLENLELPALAARERESEREARTRAREILEIVGLTGDEDEMADSLSHGQKQSLEIGMALMAKPTLLLLDEPAAGMDLEDTRRAVDLIHELARTTTTIVIEHDMEFVRDLRSQVIVLHEGRVLRRGSMAEIEQDHVVRDVYLGRTSDA